MNGAAYRQKKLYHMLTLVIIYIYMYQKLEYFHTIFIEL